MRTSNCTCPFLVGGERPPVSVVALTDPLRPRLGQACHRDLHRRTHHHTAPPLASEAIEDGQPTPPMPDHNPKHALPHSTTVGPSVPRASPRAAANATQASHCPGPAFHHHTGTPTHAEFHHVREREDPATTSTYRALPDSDEGKEEG